jgi:hypothetical protein
MDGSQVGITGLLKASHPTTQSRGSDNPKYFAIMEELAMAAEKHYRELTDETEGFYDYFYEATVVNEISLINIGSRPARRKAGVRDKSSLRAIPWVFGWAQVSSLVCIFLLLSHYHQFTNESVSKDHECSFTDLKSAYIHMLVLLYRGHGFVMAVTAYNTSLVWCWNWHGAIHKGES